jgi:hypothetical protein
MSLKGIVAITGKSGLYKVVANTKNGFIVENLQDKKRMPVLSSQQVSTLEDISIFTKTGDMPLKELLLSMKEKNTDTSGIDLKTADDKTLKDFFRTVVPEFDEERVYASHIRKIFTWYGQLKDIIAKDDEKKEEGGEDISLTATESTIPQHHASDHARVKPPEKKMHAAPKMRKKV